MSSCVLKLQIIRNLLNLKFLIMNGSPLEWFQSKLSEIEQNPQKRSNLFDMKSFVLNSEKRVLHDIASKVSLTPLFECLESQDSAEVDMACVVLLHLLSDYSGERLLSTYGHGIHRSLSSQTPKVKDTALKLLHKNLNENSTEVLTKNHQDILLEAVKCLGSNEPSTAESAKSLFIKIRSNQFGIAALYSPPILEKLREVLMKNDIAKMRVYEIFVAASLVSSENLQKAIDNGIMEMIVGELSSKDILMQLNSLEMLSNLANCEHGMTFLQEQNIIKNLIDKLASVNKDPSSTAFTHLLLPGLIEFIGNLVTHKPDYFISEYPEVMDLLFNSLETNDDVLLGVIISAVGKIGSTPVGRLELSKFDNKTQPIFKKIGHILRTKNDLTLSVLNSLSELIKDLKHDEKLSSISKNWFESVNPNPMDSIFALSKLPFVEFRFGALSLLKAVATQQWGVEKICNYPGLIEFLTDRSNEFNKDCKQMKYEILFNLLQCPIIDTLVSQQVLVILKEFVKEGPFHVPNKVEMATEGAV